MNRPYAPSPMYAAPMHQGYSGAPGPYDPPFVSSPYAPPFSSYPPQNHTNTYAHEEAYKQAEAARNIARTPSPTPSEQQALSKDKKGGMFDFKNMFAPENIKYTIATYAVLTLFVLFLVYHDKIIHKIEPTAEKLKHLKFGWLIPIGMLIVVTFPPLFGHELIAPLVGLVYGLWKGFLIVAAGTLLGEIANYFVFKYWCTTRARKMEEKKIGYGALARVVREGGFLVVLITRYSAIPGHVTTVLFSTCGIGFFSFLAAAILSLPKQLSLVFAGYVLQQQAAGDESKRTKDITIVISIVSTAATILAMRYISAKTDAVKPQIVYERRKARQAVNLSLANNSSCSLSSEGGNAYTQKTYA